MAHKLPEELSDGALVEPVAVGLHAVRQTEFTTGQTAIVFGAGPIEATTVQCARRCRKLPDDARVLRRRRPG